MTKLDKDQMDKISGGRAEQTLGTNEGPQTLNIHDPDQSQLDQDTAGPTIGSNPRNEELG